MNLFTLMIPRMCPILMMTMTQTTSTMAMTAVMLIWYTTAMIQHHQISLRMKTTLNRMMMTINQVPM
eukprot:9968046-Ditylum_brightwellii.AAC.1